MIEKSETLFDLGERRILREIIPKYVEHAGDDCASIDLSSKQLVVTTDPVPRPAAEVIGGDTDPYWLGWLLVTINASDIAASGARPEGFVAAFDIPRDFRVDLFERILQGVQDSCRANGLRYVGGNLREARELAAVGTAFGSTPTASLQRKGAQAGDHVVIIGTGGRFWFDALKLKNGGTVDKVSSPVFSPVSQCRIMHQLNENSLVHCAMDTSDGLAPTLEELALVNNLTIEVDLESIRKASGYALEENERPERLWFGWGDWTVVSAVSSESLPQLSNELAKQNHNWTTIGRFVEGQASVMLLNGSKRLRAGRLESERFAPDSWFVQGIDEYIRRLQNFPLP